MGKQIQFTVDRKHIAASLAFIRNDGHSLSIADDLTLVEWDKDKVVKDHGSTLDGARFADALLEFLTPDSLVSPQFLRLVAAGTYSDEVIVLHLREVADHAARLHPEWDNAPVINTRDAKAAELGSTSYKVGIAWIWVSGFPNETAARLYQKYVQETERRERVYFEKDQDGTYTVALHF